MPKKALEAMTESMFYTLLALLWGPKCGIEIAAFTEKLTRGRVQLGPGTLYTILSRFLEYGYLREVATEGRKRTYALTEEGRMAYVSEVGRLRQCLRDAETAIALPLPEGGDPHADQGPALPSAPPARPMTWRPRRAGWRTWPPRAGCWKRTTSFWA